MVKNFTKVRKIIFGALTFFCAVGVAQAATFSDVELDHPNAAAIDYLSKEGVIAGYPDGSFGPDNPVNRAEALKILLLASDIPANTSRSGNFPDVADEAWFAPFVFSANARSIASGYPDGFFRPEQTVNLVEALKMLFAANSISLDNYQTDEQLFADSEKRAWYNAFLFYAKTFEIVEADSSNQIFPATPLTRAQLAEVVFRFQLRVANVCPQFLENTKTIRTSYFREIMLASELPNVFYEDEVFGLQGTLANSAEKVSAIVENRETKEQSQFTSKVENQNFTVPVSFTTPGSYNFTAIPSTTNSNTAVTIEVLPRECQPATIVTSGTPPINIQTSLENNEPTITWEAAENNLFRVVIRQGENRFEKLVSANQASLTLDPADFADFVAGEATLQVFGAKAEQGWSFEPRSEWFGSTVVNLNLSQHHFSIFDDKNIILPSLPTYRGPRISLTGTARTDIEADAYLINPRGKVETVPILDNVDEIPAGAQFALNLQLPEVGTYILEINATNGIAVLNHPLYLPAEFPLLPDFADLRKAQGDDARLSVNREKSLWLRQVNDFRAQQQLPKVSLNSELSKFAQAYAEEMAAQNFFGHVDLAGNNPDARRKIFGLQLPVGENLARDSKTEYAHAGLLRSAAHRANILTPEWTRVGLGIAEDSEGRLLFVQEFSFDPLSDTNLDESQDDLLDLINAIRTERGAPIFTLDGQIGPAAQSWSEKMVAEDFTNFTNGSDSLENSIRATGYSGSFATFIATAGRLSQIVETLSDDLFTDASKTHVAIGLAQDGDGRLRVTLVFR
jgi:uncharacterized protein YkwD